MRAWSSPCVRACVPEGNYYLACALQRMVTSTGACHACYAWALCARVRAREVLGFGGKLQAKGMLSEKLLRVWGGVGARACIYI